MVSADVVAADHLLLTITDAGFGKRTDPDQFTRQGRGGQGIRAMRLHADKGQVVAALMVAEDDELFLVNDRGVTIRMPVGDISTQGRDATGVRVMNLDDETQVVAAARVEETDEDEDDGSTSDGARRHRAGRRRGRSMPDDPATSRRPTERRSASRRLPPHIASEQRSVGDATRSWVGTWCGPRCRDGAVRPDGGLARPDRCRRSGHGAGSVRGRSWPRSRASTAGGRPRSRSPGATVRRWRRSRTTTDGSP